MLSWPKRAGALLILAGRSWLSHDAQRVGAALAYYTAFSMAPILVIAIAVAGMVFGEDAAHEQISGQLTGLLGASGAGAVEDLLASAHRGGEGALATALGVITLLIGASSLFAELQGALNQMWDAPPPARTGLLNMLRTRFLSFAMVLVIGFLLLVSLVLSAVISALQGALGGVVPVPALATAISGGTSLVVSALLFGLIYQVLPDVRVAWRDVVVGAAVTALLFALGKALIGLYLGNSSLGSAYGAAGSFAVLLVWFYYSAQIILFGAEFTQIYARREGSRRGSTPEPPADGT